jgi:hypothetical protein
MLLCYILYYTCTLYLLQNIAVTKKSQSKLYNFLLLSLFTKNLHVVSYMNKVYLTAIYYNVLKNIYNDMFYSLKGNTYKGLINNVISSISSYFCKDLLNINFLIKNLYLKNM